MVHHSQFSFGDFRLDAKLHGLWRGTQQVAIQEQPYQILLALVQHPGMVVSREVLRLRLWGTSVFVDFDQSLNSAVRRLRLTLGDNSRKPIYVETLPRIGFRFLMPVAAQGGEAGAQPAAPIATPLLHPMQAESLPGYSTL
jgi:DNA-binding winged helix-turn-helix (wHTH) protein